MRIVLFDGIVETHVGSSLERSLIVAGHVVFNTGKIGHGYSFAISKASLRVINDALDMALAFQPDVIFVFRPGSLPFELLNKAKSSGAQLVAWFSDDPVLWDLSYGPVVDSYDLVLHCGTERVLRFYEEQHGRPTGVNFPFWTDTESFPYVFGQNIRESDGLFLGNVHDEVRRQRYFDLGRLTADIRIHGSVGQDYFGISGGYLDSDSEVVDAGSRAGVAINIPQYFRDHQGLDTWFPGLGELGFFQYPSRVIQYAAMGLPIVSVTPNARDLDTFPEIVCVSDMSELDRSLKHLANDPDLSELSVRTHKRFLRNYSSDSRVKALDQLLVDDSWKKLDAHERASWFTQFDGTPAADSSRNHELFNARETIEIVSNLQTEDRGLEVGEEFRIALIGRRPNIATSGMSVLSRSLVGLGHHVFAVDVDVDVDVVESNPKGNYSLKLNARRLFDRVNTGIDAIIIVGVECEINAVAHKELSSRGIKVVYLGATMNSTSKKLVQLLSRVDYMGFLNETFARELMNSGHINAHYVPHLVDSSFLDIVDSLDEPKASISVAANRRLHYSSQAKAFFDLSNWPTNFLFLEEKPNELESLEAVAVSLNSTLVIAPFDASVPGPLASELFPFALASKGITLVSRGVGPMNVGQPGDQTLAVRERGEMSMKVSRMATTPTAVARLTLSAQRLVLDKLHAEKRLVEILSSVFSVGSVADLANPEGMVEKSGEFPLQLIRASRFGSIINLSLRPSSDMTPSSEHEVLITLDGIEYYSEKIDRGSHPVTLEIRIPHSKEEFTIDLQVRAVRGERVNRSDLKPQIIVSKPEILRPQQSIEKYGVRTTSPWGRSL